MHAAALYRALTQPSMLRGLSARACLGSALSCAAFALVWLGRPHEANLLTSEALSAAREGADDRALSWALVVASLSAGDLSARRPLLDEALGLSRSLSSGYYGEGLVLIGYSRNRCGPLRPCPMVCSGRRRGLSAQRTARDDHLLGTRHRGNVRVSRRRPRGRARVRPRPPAALRRRRRAILLQRFGGSRASHRFRVGSAGLHR
jgi:hypothetical protein